MGGKRRRRFVGLALLALAAVLLLFRESTRRERVARPGVAEPGRAPVARSGADDVGASEPSPAWEVRVTVLARGQPVAGARVELFGPEQEASWVRLQPSHPSPAAAAWTGADGVASLPARRGGAWTAIARHAGHAPGRAATTLTMPERAVELTIRLRPGCTLSGRVFDESGAPVADTVVRGGVSLQGRQRFRTVATRTDEAGRYRLDDLPPGMLQVAAGEPRGHFVAVECPFDGECNLVLRSRGALEGRVTDVATGAPLAGARLRVEARGSIGFAVTGDDGRYRCGGLRPGEVHRIAVALAGYVPLHPAGVVGPADGSLYLNPAGPSHPGRVTLAIPVRRGATTTYDIALRRGARIAGVVRGPGGPVADAEVNLVTNRAQNGYLVEPVRTDAEGRYEFDGVLAGPALVRPSKPGYYDPHGSGASWHSALQGRRPAPNRVVVPETGVVRRDLELAAARSVQGSVTSDGKPVAGARIVVHQARAGRTLFGTTAGDGSFLVAGLLPDHAAEVRCLCAGFAPSRTEELAARLPPAPLRFELEPLPRVRGRVTDGAGEPVADVMVLVIQEVTVSTSPHALEVFTDGDGNYERPLLGAEQGFQVEVRPIGLPAASSDRVALVPGRREYRVDLTVAPGATLRGFVRNAAGEPVPHVHVRVAGKRDGRYVWHLPIRAASGADGSFEVKGAPSFPLTLHAAARGYRPQRLAVESAGPVLVTLEPTRTIHGVVRHRDGSPAAGVAIAAYPAEGKRFDIYFVVRPDALRSDGIPGPAEARTDAEGRFAVSDLGDGQYRLLVAPGQTLRAVGDTVVRGGAGEVRLTVEPATGGEFGSLTDEDAGRMARYLALRNEHEKAVGVWRDLLGRNLDAATGVIARIELGRSLEALARTEEWEAVAREAVALAPAAAPPGLTARYHLARAILARGRAREALTLAEEVAAGKSTDAAAAARGELVAILALAELGELATARQRLDRLGHEAERLADASLRILVRNAAARLATR